jgi:hypothetical protein
MEMKGEKGIRREKFGAKSSDAGYTDERGVKFP